MKTVPQLTLDDVKRLAAQGRHGEIEDARLAGKLDVLLGGQPRITDDAVLTLDDVRQLAAQGRHGEIEDARASGRINYTEEQ